MASWYIEKKSGSLGPYSSTQLKHLADSGQLRPDDPVRRADQEKGVAAGKIKGLFPKNVPQDRQLASPPPLPTADAPHPPPTRSEPPPLPTSKGALDSLSEGLKAFIEASKAAARLTAAQARKTHLVNVTLRAAYLDLGRDIHDSGRFRDEFPELYAEIGKVGRQIEQLTTARPKVSSAKGLADRATSAAVGMKVAARAKALSSRKASLLRRLGESAFAKHGEQSDPESLSRAITDCLARTKALEEEIRRLSKIDRERLLRPGRLLIAGAGFGAVLFALTLGRIALHEHPDPPAGRDGAAPLIVGKRLDSGTRDSVVRGQEVVEEGAEGPAVVLDREPSDAGKGGEVAASAIVPRGKKRGPPYVVETKGSPRLIVRRRGLRITSRGRLWEQRIEYGGLCFSPDGKTLAAGGMLRDGFVTWRGAVLLVDAATGATLTAMNELHDRQINRICFSPDGKLMATGSGGIAKVWGTDPPCERGSFEFTHPKVAEMTGIYHEVTSLLFTRDGKRLIAVGGLDSSPPIVGTLMAWDYPGGTPAYSVHPGYRLESASLGPDGQTLVTGSATGRIDLWQSATGEHITMKLDSGASTGRAIVRTQPDGERVIVGMETSGPFNERRTPYKLSSIDIKSGSRYWSKDGPTPALKRIDVSPDGRLIVCGGNQIDLWDSNTGEIVASIDGFRSPVTCIAYSPDGKRFAASVPSGDNAGSVWVWDVEYTK